jgi:hypothetical protein
MMNDRIRQLAEQADWWKPLGLPSDWDDGDYVVTKEQMKKFAELIVRECTNMLPTDSIRNEEGVHIFYVIRDHFGVSPYEGVR